ncbi:hypothetical protein MGYG_08095 [Nannizzia gypsea CBS 118893]|uniref:Uncharacterized protein n=1 Tax=Arthroderma gypseum (strain ATCC MYA-4604 / CBS 118893) TaxID=535722 RepID=E4V512_ARTGP|nr:hypothetical protein MGYG_08095 [Nannizzia gypsea CBS 118893]EFR05086.1 hypothetical protein MGYG_08095 [Nannizzia gypsea CBS 118893]
MGASRSDRDAKIRLYQKQKMVNLNFMLEQLMVNIASCKEPDLCLQSSLLPGPLNRTASLWTLGTPGYHLSGIDYTPGARILKEKYILSLRDPTAACIGRAKENAGALQVSPVPHPFTPRDFDDSNSSLQGYLIHSRCWDLIEHNIGPVAGFKLDLLVAALQKQWDNLMPRLQAGPFCDYIQTHLSKHEKEHRCILAFEDYMHWDNKTTPGHSSEACWSLPDPIFIPELDSLFQDCKQKSSVMKRSLRQTLTLDYRLPLEILMCIADYLTFQELYTTLTASEEEFPVGYWKQRIPVNLFLN